LLLPQSRINSAKKGVINSLIIIFTDLTVLFVMPEDLNRASIPDQTGFPPSRE
jgi:hypothetical protein